MPINNYTPVTWVNGSEAGSTPLNATNLNKMEDGIENIYTALYPFERLGSADGVTTYINLNDFKITGFGFADVGATNIPVSGSAYNVQYIGTSDKGVQVAYNLSTNYIYTRTFNTHTWSLWGTSSPVSVFGYTSTKLTDIITSGVIIDKNLATIPAGKTRGRAIIRNGSNPMNYNITVNFYTYANRSYAYMSGSYTDYNTVANWCYRDNQSITTSEKGRYVASSTSIYVLVKDIYIDGNILYVSFFNGDSLTRSLDCTIDWEVW